MADFFSDLANTAVNIARGTAASMLNNKMPGAYAVTGSAVSGTNPSSVLLPAYTVTIQQEAIPAEGRGVVTVKAHLPEDYSEDTQSEYDTPFADGLITDRRLQTLGQAAGWSPTTQSMTAHFWKGSSPIEIQLPLVLVAFNDSSEITDTILKLKGMQMPRVDPTTKFLRAPGPRLEFDMKAAEALWDSTKSAASSIGEIITGAASDNAPTGSTASGSAPAATTMERLAQVGRNQGTAIANAGRSLIKPIGTISIRLGTFRYFPDMVIRSVSDQYNIVLGPDGRPMRATVTISAITRVTPVFEDLPGIYCVESSQSKLVGKK